MAEAGTITIKTELDTKTFDAQISDLEGKIADLEKQELYFSSNGMAGELQDVQTELEKARNKLVQLKEQQDKINSSAGKGIASKLSGINSGLKSIGNTAKNVSSKISKGLSGSIDKTSSSFGNAIKKAGKLVLGIFAIRSAYMALRRASSELASYDKQYGANIEYIRYALTQAIAPILRYIVSLVGTILGYINSIIAAITGINIFSNASADNFKKMKNSAGGVAKSAKEIKKQLAGFDEMNVLTNNSSSSGGGRRRSSYSRI